MISMASWLGFLPNAPQKYLKKPHTVRPVRYQNISGCNQEFLGTAFFLGINDCGGIPGEDLSSLVEAVFNAIHKLYIRATARNFILVDVPPTNRSPAGKYALWLQTLVFTWIVQRQEPPQILRAASRNGTIYW